MLSWEERVGPGLRLAQTSGLSSVGSPTVLYRDPPHHMLFVPIISIITLQYNVFVSNRFTT